MPFSLKLSVWVSSCAVLTVGLVFAWAALIRSPELIAISALVFALTVTGASVLLIWRVGILLEACDETADDQDIFQDMTLGQEGEAAAFPAPEEKPATENGASLRRTQKAQAVDRLRDGITHDLNNRLMVISANIDAVARQLKDQPNLQRKLLSALVASDQAAKLIAKSADFSRQGEAKVQYVNLAERLDSVAALMGRSLLRDTVELHLSLDEDLWPIEADPDDVETAIVTLSAHVRDALHQGGTITLEARNVQVQEGSLSNLNLTGDFVRLAIRSDAAEDVLQGPEDIHEQAFSLRDIDLSSWLNLSQSLHFLRALGGASEVRHDGAGTSIILYLPRAHAATLLTSASPGDEETPGENVTGHTEILVVDDEVEVALALQSTLEEFGYVTSIATEAGEAMRILSQRKPGLVLADVALRGAMNGVMLAREVREIHHDLPILLITGSPVVSDEESEFPLLHKPIVSRDLHAAIQRHLTKPDGKVVRLFPRTRSA